MAGQLWAKDLPLDAAIHRYTVGDDPQLDLQLLPWDCLGSAAHARMLGHIGVLATDEVQALLAALQALHADALAGTLQIPAELEDGHTLIESRLSAMLGDAGARIHTGRSRNDQVTLAQNLWQRDQVFQHLHALATLAGDLLAFGRRHRTVELPGYTHLQRAMPSSLGQWAAALAEALIEEMDAGLAVLARLDRCPLGAAAGYGVPLPLDRALVARLLGYKRVHIAPPDAIAARQRHALAFCDWSSSIAGILERFAWDLSLWTSAEFGFVQLDPAFTTGSSIMPQKRNPDVVELLRARCRQQRAYAHALAQIGTGLPSGYHRDFQLGKAPLLEASSQLGMLLDVARRVLAAVRIQPAAMQAALSDDLYATAAAYALVQAGMPFRQAYKHVGLAVQAGTFQRVDVTPSGSSLGAPQRPGLQLLVQRLRRASGRIARRETPVRAAWATVWSA